MLRSQHKSLIQLSVAIIHDLEHYITQYPVCIGNNPKSIDGQIYSQSSQNTLGFADDINKIEILKGMI